MSTSGRLNNSGIDLAGEVKHRQKASATGGDSTLDDVEDEYNRPFQTDDQQVFLWHLANTNQRPRSIRPAFRLLGLFPSIEEATAHGRRLARADPDSPCALRISSVNEWYSIPQHHHEDIEPHRLKVNRNLETHAQKVADAEVKFKQRKKALTKGAKPSYQGAAKDAVQQVERRAEMSAARAKLVEENNLDGLRELEMAEARAETERNAQPQQQHAAAAAAAAASSSPEAGGEEEEEYKEEELPRPPAAEALDENWDAQMKDAAESWGDNVVPALPVGREAEVRNQKYASISVLHDYEGNGAEPAIIVYAAFDSEVEALKYNKKVASKEVKDHDIGIVNLYEWVYPHLIHSDKVEQLYRNDVLNRIMKHSRTSKQTVSNFERECVDKSIDIPSIEVTPDLVEPAPRLYKRQAPIGSGLDLDEEDDGGVEETKNGSE
jgi:hypothetical protein